MLSKCLNLEIMPRDLLIFEEINNISCCQVRIELMRTPRYLTISLSSLEELLKNFYHQIALWLCRSSCVSDKAAQFIHGSKIWSTKKAEKIAISVPCPGPSPPENLHKQIIATNKSADVSSAQNISFIFSGWKFDHCQPV